MDTLGVYMILLDFLCWIPFIIYILKNYVRVVGVQKTKIEGESSKIKIENIVDIFYARFDLLSIFLKKISIFPGISWIL